MNQNNLKELLLGISTLVQPIVNGLNQILKDPKTIEVIENIATWMHETERTLPFMEQMVGEIKSNSNLAEAGHTITYKQLFTLLSHSDNIKNTSLYDLINQGYFQQHLLECFDEVEITGHFNRRKSIIEEAFKLYELKFYAGCLCLLLSQLEGIITDYLIFKKIIIKNPNTKKFEYTDGKQGSVTGLSEKIQLAKNINKNFSRLELFKFDQDSNRKFNNERNDILHGSNIDNFTIERCLILFIWIDSIVGSIYKEEVINSLSRK
jgi:hypothetical protein